VLVDENRIEKINKIPKYQFYYFIRTAGSGCIYYFISIIPLGTFKSVKRINAVPCISRALFHLERDLEYTHFPPPSRGSLYHHRKNANDPKSRVQASICTLRRVLSV